MTNDLTINEFSSGILLLDKAYGESSHYQLERVKRLLKIKKVGHTGTLDPMATGMLPLCLGDSTKYAHYFLILDKVYVVEATLGVTTTTADAEGDIVTQKKPDCYTEKVLSSSCQHFVGVINQVPPMYSAVKVNGKPLYKLAREGKVIERKPRQVTVKSIDILQYRDDKLIMRVACSKGTYIRTLVEDIGEHLGCGAFVSELRRISVGVFNQSDMISLNELRKHVESNQYQFIRDMVLPIDSALEHYSSYTCNRNEIVALFRGQCFKVSADCVSGLVRVYYNDQFVGMAEVSSGHTLKAKRLINCDRIESLSYSD